MRTPGGRTVTPLTETVPSGADLYRVHLSRFPADAYNPGSPPAVPHGRFSFFGNPPVPVLYASATADGAISEAILRDVPIAGGHISARFLEPLVLSTIVTTRSLELLSLHGHGFRRIGLGAQQLTLTPPSNYALTVPWAAAAYEAGLDGIAWMSRHHNTSKVFVFFARPGTDPNFDTPVGRRAFARLNDLDWLTRQLAPLNVTITVS